MALGQVSARIEGDLYQGLVFWREAAQLLKKSNKSVQKVCFELDSAPGVDDVVVFYHNIIQTGDTEVDSDYYQIKYHVDQKGTYSSDSVIDSATIKADHSILQKFYKAYKLLRSQGRTFRLFFMSNWDWDGDDPLKGTFRENDGSLPAIFFTAGSKTKLGQIRNKWRKHLDIDEAEFLDFTKCLRINANYLARQDFYKLVSQSFELAGLQPLDPEKKINPYEALYLKLLMEKNNEFDAEKLRKICENEGLIIKEIVAQPPRIGIRGFRRFAERMEDETIKFLCLLDLFEGRHLKSDVSWKDVKDKITKFFEQADIRKIVRESDIFLDLDCHLSSALVAGYELDFKSGAKVFPIQKNVPNIYWKPVEERDSHWGLSEKVVGLENTSGDDIAFLVSISRPVSDLAIDYIKSQPNIGTAFTFESNTGVGHSSILNATHAQTLANSLVQRLRDIKGVNQKRVLHLFIAAPNSFVYFLGQNREGLGKVQMYEFDFSNEKSGGYIPSVSLP